MTHKLWVMGDRACHQKAECNIVFLFSFFNPTKWKKEQRLEIYKVSNE